MHRGARAVRDAARPRPGRHRHRAVVHVHDHRARLRPPGRAAAVLRHRAATRSASTRRTSPRCSTTPCAPSCVVHYAGIACDIEGIRAVLADRPDIALIEDNAHGLFGTLARTSRSGSFGRFAAQSFHETKNFVCGEGGALLLNDAARRRPRPGALRQGHQPAGVHARPGRQVLLEGHRLVVRARRRAGGVPAGPARAARRHPGQAPAVTEHYRAGSGAARRRARLRADADARPTASRRTTCSTCCCPTGEQRDAVLELDAGPRACMATFHYVPLHSSDAGQMFAARADRLPGHRRHQRSAAAAALLQQPRRPDDIDRVAERFRRVGRRRPRGSEHERRRRRPSRARRRCSSPTTGGTAPGPTCSRPCSAPYLGRPSAVARRGQRRRPRASAGCEHDGRGRQPRPVPRWSEARRGRVRLGDGAAVPRRGLRRGRRLRRRRALRGRGAGDRRAGPRARARRAAAALGAGLPVGLVRPRRPRRAPPPLHPAPAGGGGRGRRAAGRALDVRLRGGVPVLRRRAGGAPAPAAASAGPPRRG